MYPRCKCDHFLALYFFCWTLNDLRLRHQGSVKQTKIEKLDVLSSDKCARRYTSSNNSFRSVVESTLARVPVDFSVCDGHDRGIVTQITTGITLQSPCHLHSSTTTMFAAVRKSRTLSSASQRRHTTCCSKCIHSPVPSKTHILYFGEHGKFLCCTYECIVRGNYCACSET